MKRGPEMFAAFLDAIQAGGDVSKACRRLRISRMSVIRWLKESKAAAAAEEQNSVYRFEYGGTVDWLHNFKRDAERAIVEDVLANALIRARDGTRQPALYQGATVYKLNPKFEETAETRKIESDADLYILGYETRWLRDENFAKVPETVWTPPSNELVLGVLGSYVKRFAKRQHIEHDHRHSGGIGVMVANQNARERLPMVEVIEPAAEAVITDATNVREPDEVEEPEAIAAPASEPAPPAPPPKPMSDLQRDLIDRARARGLL